MSGKKIRNSAFAVFIILLFVVVPAVSATAVYYSQEQPVTSPEGLKISSYKILTDFPEIYAGDEVTARYMLQYEPTGDNQLVIDQPGGLFFDLTNPQGFTVRLGSNFVGKTLFPGDYISVSETFLPDKPGIWKISPGYTVITGNGMQKVSSPKDWQIAEINVLGREDPKPDLIIESIKADFDTDNNVISRISYTIKNIGEADSGSSATALFVDDKIIDSKSNVGFLPSGEGLTIFEPVRVPYSGSTSLIRAEADYDKNVNESDYENNYYEVIIENPGFQNIYEEVNSGEESGLNKISEIKSSQIVDTEYNKCPVLAQDCSDICFICGVVGLLSVLLSVLSFALGYFYGLNKNCEREVRWMRSKIDILRSNKGDSEKGFDPNNSAVAEKMEEELEKAIDNMKNNKQSK